MTDAATFLHHDNSPLVSTGEMLHGASRMSSKCNRTVVPKLGTYVPCERELAAERMFAFLREIYPHKTMEHVAADLGVSVETVAKWRSRKSLPEALTCLRMMFIYGHEFFRCVAPEMARQLKENMDADQRRLKELTHL